MANPNEKIVTLDEVERQLHPSMLMICDLEKPVAVGGVMGGSDSGITEETTDVLLEVAYFERDSIRKTSRDLHLSSEASYHFERGVDINNLIRASNRATELICELANGTAGRFVDAYPNKAEPVEIDAPNIGSEVERLSGLKVEESEIERILGRLGLENKSDGLYISPSWRHDLSIEEDLVEEVVRITGYDKIPEELPAARSSGEYQPTESRKRVLRQTLSNLGFDEALSYSFIDERHDEIFEVVPNLLEATDGEKLVSIKDPIIEGSTRMRPSLLSGLLDAVKVNFNHQNRSLKLFEVGKVFAKTSAENDLPVEKELMGIVMTGDETFENTAFTSRPLDFLDIKGALEASMTAINSKPMDYRASDVKHFRKGQSAEVILEESAIGYLGCLSDNVASKYKFKQPVYLAEIDLQAVLEASHKPSAYRPLPVFPGIARDVSLLTKRTVTYEQIRGEVEAMGFELCKNVGFVAVFEGKGMADDERSITIRLEYRSDDRTLTEEEVEKVHQVILSALKVNLGITQR
jgi:phenylalanyl-tRNA synthetase beta chain